MSRVSIASYEDTVIAQASEIFTGTGELRAYLDGSDDPIHVYLHSLASGQQLRVSPRIADCALYVWRLSSSAAPRQSSQARRTTRSSSRSAHLRRRRKALAVTCT
jgi:hypothetical protein